MRRPELRWQHVNGAEGGTDECCRGVKCEVRIGVINLGPGWALVPSWRSLEQKGVGKAQAEGARPQNLRAMTGLGLVSSWASVWGMAQIV